MEVVGVAGPNRAGGGRRPAGRLACESFQPTIAGSREMLVLRQPIAPLRPPHALELTRFRGHLSIGGARPQDGSPHAKNATALPTRVPPSLPFASSPG